jgi:hypothetical protein
VSFRDPPPNGYEERMQANVRLSDRRYQQLELNHQLDRGVCGAMEFR